MKNTVQVLKINLSVMTILRSLLFFFLRFQKLVHLRSNWCNLTLSEDLKHSKTGLCV